MEHHGPCLIMGYIDAWPFRGRREGPCQAPLFQSSEFRIHRALRQGTALSPATLRQSWKATGEPDLSRVQRCSPDRAWSGQTMLWPLWIHDGAIHATVLLIGPFILELLSRSYHSRHGRSNEHRIATRAMTSTSAVAGLAFGLQGSLSSSGSRPEICKRRVLDCNRGMSQTPSCSVDNSQHTQWLVATLPMLLWIKLPRGTASLFGRNS